VIPNKNHTYKHSDDGDVKIYIRCGQLNSENRIIGLGRKIVLNPIYYRDQIINLSEEKSYIEEGELKNDKLDGTFGRRISFKGSSNFGWF